MPNAKASPELEQSDIPLPSQSIGGKAVKNILAPSLLSYEINLNIESEEKKVSPSHQITVSKLRGFLTRIA